jgi:serine/threonine-protein phosphatase 2A regulatory subunit A
MNLPDDVRVATTLSLILPCVKDLVSDPNQQVRASLASNIMGLAPVLGKQK